MRFALKSVLAALAIAAAALAQPTPADAASYNVSGGELTGVNALVVPSLGVFNVAFVDGACATVFADCGGAGTAFRFTSRDDALAAMAALSDLLIAAPLGLNAPPATNIFGSATTADILTPFDFAGGFASAIGKAVTTDPTVTTLHTTFVQSRPAALDTAGSKAVWAQFSAVPLPLPGALLGGVLVAALGLARLRRSA